MHEYVSNLEISVDNIFFSEIVETIKDIFYDWFSSILIKIAVFPQPWLEISFITEFSDDIAVAIACEDLMTFENIGVI